MREPVQPNAESASPSLDVPGLDLSGKADSVAEVRRLILESEVSSQPPTPDWSDWINHVASRMLEAMAEWIGGSAENVALFARLLAFSLLAVLAVVLVAAMLRAVRRAGRAPAAALEGAGSDPVVAASPTAATVPEVPIEELLELGDAAAALRSVWWSFAEHLGVRSARDSSWTGRRLLRRSGREDLLPLVKDLEQATYGGEATTLDAVRQLWQRTAAVIGSGSSPAAERGRPE